MAKWLMAKSTAIGSPTMRTDNKRSEGNYIHGKKDGPWITYHKNGNKASEAAFRDDKYEGPLQ